MTQITIRCFGMLCEVLGNDSIVVPFAPNTDGLLTDLKQHFPRLNNLTFSVAVNKKIVTEPVLLQVGDEIALLPPFSGG